MLRTLCALIAVSTVLCSSGYPDESSVGNCTIVNTTDHPVVIGLYRPSFDGIKERLICVPPRTEMRAVPVKLCEDEQFVVAYRAQSEANEISRTAPIKVDGHKRVRLIERRKDPDSPNVLIQYRGGRSESYSDRDDRSNSLYLPDMEVEAKRILREANYTSRVIATSLAKQDYTETAEQVDARESSAPSGLNSKSTPRSP